MSTCKKRPQGISTIKYLLGSITKLFSYEKIGVIVFDDYIDYAKRLVRYLNFIERVKKVNEKLFRNIFVVSKSAVSNLLQIYE